MTGCRRVGMGLSILVLTVALVACATTDGAKESSSSNHISHSELTNSSTYGGSAYEVIRDLRPQWFSKRVSTARSAEIQVYLDGAQIGNSQKMHDISSEDLQEVRYLDGPSASMRFGTDHGHGAILLKTKR